MGGVLVEIDERIAALRELMKVPMPEECTAHPIR